MPLENDIALLERLPADEDGYGIWCGPRTCAMVNTNCGHTNQLCQPDYSTFPDVHGHAEVDELAGTVCTLFTLITY
jgi:hypothetical protein